MLVFVEGDPVWAGTRGDRKRHKGVDILILRTHVTLVNTLEKLRIQKLLSQQLKVPLLPHRLPFTSNSHYIFNFQAS